MKHQGVHVNFLSSEFVTNIIHMLIQSFPRNYRFKQLALPYVLISLKLHANTVMKLNVINLTFKLTDSYIYILVQGFFWRGGGR